LAELCGLRLWCLRCRFLGGRHNQLSAMRFQHPFHGRREVDEEVEAIGDLLRLWCPARRPFGIKPATIPRDGYDLWVLLEPGGEALGATLGEQIDDAV